MMISELKNKKAEKEALQKTKAAAETLKEKKQKQKKKQKLLEGQIQTGEELSEDAKKAAAAISRDLTNFLR